MPSPLDLLVSNPPPLLHRHTCVLMYNIKHNSRGNNPVRTAVYIYCNGVWVCVCVCVCDIALDCTGITVPFLFFTPLFFFCSRYTFFTLLAHTLLRRYAYACITIPDTESSDEDPNAPDTLTGTRWRRSPNAFPYYFYKLHFTSHRTRHARSPARDGVSSGEKRLGRSCRCGGL